MMIRELVLRRAMGGVTRDVRPARSDRFQESGDVEGLDGENAGRDLMLTETCHGFLGSGDEQWVTCFAFL